MSDAHYILTSFFEEVEGSCSNIKEMVQFDYDPEGENFPEVLEAWKAAGHEVNMPTVATCPNMSQWAVGMGGKKNAERAAKLALAVTLATVSDPAKVMGIVNNFPMFGQLISSIGLQLPASA